MSEGFEQEKVNHPTHYQGDKVECIEVMKALFTPEMMKGFCMGNAFKYIWRAGKKGAFTEDIQKAQWYLRYIERYYAELEEMTND